MNNVTTLQNFNFDKSKSLNSCSFGENLKEDDESNIKRSSSYNFQRSSSWNKYTGNIRKRNDRLSNLRQYHNLVKEHFIRKYCENSFRVVDIGSGRGSDIKHYIANNVQFIIGIEPSTSSIKKSISYYSTLRKNDEIVTRAFYLNGFGHLEWHNGFAAKRDEDRPLFITNFGAKSRKAKNINLFWTIHYMMNNRDELNTLMNNINGSIMKKGIVTILCMDGDKIDWLLKKNSGIYEIKNEHDIPIFSIKSDDPKYSEKQYKNISKLGNKIEVKMVDTYGLRKGIEENLVYKDFLIEEFRKKGFKLIEQTKFLDIEHEQKDQLTEYERQISDLYLSLVFQKI